MNDADDTADADPAGDAAILKQLRAAHDLLAERPSGAVRAAVLHAAAERATGVAPGSPRGTATGASNRGVSGAAPVSPSLTVVQPPAPRWRWPLAVAASLLVGTVAVRLAFDVEHRPAADQAADQAAPRSVAAAPAAASAELAPAAAPRAAPGADRLAAQAPAGASSAPAADALSAPAPAETAPQWLDRIIKLRRSGRDVEADRELARLRARYPQLSVPPAALRPAAAAPHD